VSGSMMTAERALWMSECLKQMLIDDVFN